MDVAVLQIALAVEHVERKKEVPDLHSLLRCYGDALGPKPIAPRIRSVGHVDQAECEQVLPVKSQPANIGVEAVATSREEFTAYLESEMARYAKVIREANIRPE